MSFSEYFSQYVKAYKISVPKLSKSLGIDRATLYRYLSGDRIPKDISTVEFIADGLCMKADERSRFLEEYDKSILGEDIVNSFLYMRDLIEELKTIDDLINPKYDYRDNKLIQDFLKSEKSVALSSSHSIVSYAMRILNRCVKSGAKRIILIMQPTYSEIQELLLPFLGESDITVQQLVCFEKTIDKCYINLDILKDILPQSFGLKDFNVYYHYDSLTSHLNSLSFFPNIIIAEDCAMMFDYEMRSGFFSMDKTLADFLCDKFDSLSKTCFTLLEKGNYANDVRNMNSALTGLRLGTLFDQPCVAPCFDIEFLTEAIYDFPQKKLLIDALVYQYGDWNETEHIEDLAHVERVTSCFTKGGIKAFAESGRIGEFPDMYYREISVRNRINILKRMIILIEQEKYRYIVFKRDVGFPKNMQVYWDPDDRTVAFRKISKDNIVQISIKESSVYSTIINFLQYIEHKNLVLTNEECIAFIEGVIADLESKL